MVWVANLFAWIFTHVMAPLFTHLDEVKTLVEILAWGLTGAFTIWQWRSAAKKNRRR
jgi:hypothetical protein